MGPSDYITWERVALGVIAILVGLLGFVASQIQQDMVLGREAVYKLNETLIELRVELAASKQDRQYLAQRITELRGWVGKLSGRIHVLEMKRK